MRTLTKEVTPLPTPSCVSGDICCFHNFRVLHGRSSYTPTAAGQRHLEGGYIEWDELSSMRRVLKARLNIPDSEY